MPNEHETETRRYLALYHGVVVDNRDPLMLARVRIRVAGVIEPSTTWAFPFGTSGGGDTNRGGFWVPKIGSECVVFFSQGDPDFPFYACGHWGAPGGVRQAPSFVTEQPGITPEMAALISGWEMDRFVFYFDDRPDQQSFQIRDKVSGDCIAYDSTTRKMLLKATTLVKIEALGAVEIEGLSVKIQGRVVTPGDEKI
jgi:hypothetical protein